MAATGRRRSEDTTAAPSNSVVHSACTPVHNSAGTRLRRFLPRFAPSFHRALRKPARGPPAVAMFAAARPFRGPSHHPIRPTSAPEEAVPRSRVRRRTPPRLATHPAGAAASRGRVHVAHLARAARAPLARGGGPGRRGARRDPAVGRRALLARPARVHRGRARSGRPDRARGARRGRAPDRPRAAAPGRGHRRRLGVQPALHLRPVRHRRRQPARPRGRARRRRDARPGLQPALHLRAARPRQDAPAALDRQLRARARRRHVRALHDRRGLHGPVRRRAPERRDRGLQVRLPQRRRAARRRRPVPAEQGPHRAGVLPHLQRAPGRRRPARAHLRPAPAQHGQARGPPARALRVRAGHRRPPARRRHPPHGPAQARPAGRARPRRRRARDASPRAWRRTCARSRAR